jgi:hypothetical protein
MNRYQINIIEPPKAKCEKCAPSVRRNKSEFEIEKGRNKSSM